MTHKNFILATAGHVDHGKSALAKALTGTDPDRLPEEKARGITIELGFAHLELPSPNEPDVAFSIGIIDVPGHEDFVKNMVAGVGAIDLALLVVAADDGWMPQTEEHLQILSYLGTPRIIVALTKIDLPTARGDAEDEIRAQLRDSPFADAAIVKTSLSDARTVDGIRAMLAREFSTLTPPRDIDRPRLFVDRAFSLRGVGTVATGTLVDGKFHRGDSVVIQPANIPARIRSLQNHNREVAEIGPGMRAALNVPDVSIGDEDLRRGNVITRSGFGAPCSTIDALIARSARAGATRLLRHGARLRVHHGSGNFPARIFFEDGTGLNAGKSAIARIRLETSIFAFVGDRFVLRDSSERRTLAGGIVLDLETMTRRFRAPEQLLFLKNRARAPFQAEVLIQTQMTRDRFLSRETLLTQSCLSEEEISAALRKLVAERKVLVRGSFAIDASWWSDALERAFAAIDAEHKSHPQHAGLDLVQLRNLFATEPSEIFEALVRDVCQRGAERIGDVIKRASHQATLPQPLQAVGEKIRGALASKPFDPPSRKELAPDSRSQQALRFFLQTGDVIEINGDVVLSKEAAQKMRDLIVEFLRKNESATVSQLRSAAQTSRRVMVPFLEWLDREGVTQRIGDKRILAPRNQGAAVSRPPK